MNTSSNRTADRDARYSQPPTVSVVIPAYNAARLLPETLDSVFAQTVPPLEIIVVDDGSEDGTPQLMGSYAQRVTYLRKERGGPASARNLGILSARGEWIAFLDADDLCMPDRLERQLELAEATTADLVFSDATTMEEKSDARTTRFVQYGLRNRFATLAPEGFLHDPFGLLFEAGCYVLPSTVIVRRKTVLEIGLFDEGIYCNEDMDLWLRLALKHRFAVVVDSLVMRRKHGKNISDDPWTVVIGELKVCESLEKRNPVAPNVPWRKLLRRKKAALYRQQGSLLLQRNEIGAARRSWAKSFCLFFSPEVGLYWLASFLPGNWLIALRDWKVQDSLSFLRVKR